MTNPLQHDRYLRSNNYNASWVTEGQMGPNVLWLTESHLEADRGENVGFTRITATKR